MIITKNLKKIYVSKSGSEVHAVKDLSLQFNAVGLTIITGKSGSGKTTLLNILSSLDKQTSGEVLFNGNIIGTVLDEQTYRSKCISFIFQCNNLIKNETVYQNVITALKLNDLKIDKQNVMSILEKVGIADKTDVKVKFLSGGQEQRVSIARALVKETEVIFADEPTANLDEENSDIVFGLLKEISKTKLVIMVSHDFSRSYSYADRIIEMEDGKIIKDVSRDDDVNTDDVIAIPSDYEINEDIVTQLNETKRKLSVISKNNYVDSKIKRYDLKREYSAKKNMSVKNLGSILASSMWSNKLKVIPMIIACVLAFAIFGLSLMVTSYNSGTALSLTYDKTNQDELVIMQGSYDKYDKLQFSKNKMPEDVVNHIIDNFDQNLFEINNMNGFKIPNSDLGNESISPAGIKGVYEIDEEDLAALGFILMDFPYINDENPAKKSRFPKTGRPVQISATKKVNEVVVTDYLVYTIYKEEFGIDMDNLPESQNPEMSDFEYFLNSGFERVFMGIDLSQFIPNNLKIVGIVDTGYKEKYISILEDGISYDDKLSQEFISDVEGKHSLVYSGEGFAETCHTNDLITDDFHYIIEDTSTYNYYNDNNKISYISGYKNEFLNHNRVLLDVQSFEMLTGVEFNDAATTPYKFLNSYNYTDFEDLEIVGVIDTRAVQKFDSVGMVISPSFISNLSKNNSYVIGASISIQYANTQDLFMYMDDNAIYNNMINYNLVYEVSNMIESLQSIFLPILIAICIVAILISGVFIGGNIYSKRYKAGLYRCLGAKKSDVIKYIGAESLIYVIVVLVLSLISSFLGLTLFNTIFNSVLSAYNPTLLAGITLMYSTAVPYLICGGIILVISSVFAGFALYRINQTDPINTIRRAD